MKRHLILLVFLLGATFVRAQRSSDKIYWVALDRYTRALDSIGSNNSNTKTIFLQKSDYVDSIPQKVNGYNIVLITPANQRKLYKDHNERLVHTVMFPLSVQDSILNITFTPYFGTFKDNNYNLAVSDGMTVYFKYDCIKRQFVVFKVEEWEI